MTKINQRWWFLPLIFLILLGLVTGVAYVVTRSEQATEQSRLAEMSDAERFKAEYPKVTEANPFVYASNDEVMQILTEGSGVVFLGFPECPWCQQIVPRMEAAAREEGVDKIYYLNIRQARANKEPIYRQLVDYLEDYLGKDDNGQPHITVPDVTAVKNGQVMERFEHESGSGITADNYWVEERESRGIERLEEIMRASL